jgi:alpha-L-fucosidase
MTMNNNWAFNRGDRYWKSPEAVVSLLATAAQGKGNLLLNIGPRGDGSIPEPSVEVIEKVGRWLQQHGECIYDTDAFNHDLMERLPEHNGDWCSHGMITLKGKALYLLASNWPGRELVLAGLSAEVDTVTLLGPDGGHACTFEQDDRRITVTGLPDYPPDPVCPVMRFDCHEVPQLRLGGGMRIPNAPHPPYDPCQSDIAH